MALPYTGLLSKPALPVPLWPVTRLPVLAAVATQARTLPLLLWLLCPNATTRQDLPDPPGPRAVQGCRADAGARLLFAIPVLPFASHGIWSPCVPTGLCETKGIQHRALRSGRLRRLPTWGDPGSVKEGCTLFLPPPTLGLDASPVHCGPPDVGRVGRCPVPSAAAARSRGQKMGRTQHTGLLREQGQTDTALCRDVLGLPSGPSAWPLPCLPLLTNHQIPHTHG